MSWCKKEWVAHKWCQTKLCCLFRYVWILNSLLSGSIKMNTSPLFLHCIIIHGMPRFDPAGGQCSSGLHVHHVLQLVHNRRKSYNSQNWSGFKNNPFFLLHHDVLQCVRCIWRCIRGCRWSMCQESSESILITAC